MLGAAWRIEAVKSRITNKQPKVTKDSAYSAQKPSIFSNEKLAKAINLQYTPIKKCIKRIAENYAAKN